METRKKIEMGDDNLPGKERRENDAFGIFRLVTESYFFGKSALGQKLLSLRVEIKEFASTTITLE